MPRSLFASLLSLALLARFASAQETPPPQPPRTVVSLTFDDGTSDHVLASALLAERGMKGTFYINSGQIGTSEYYLSLAQLRAIAAAGHEIGGHTLNHKDMAAVSHEERARQICLDRAKLAEWGFLPGSFAFPFGSFNRDAQRTVEACGYRTARIVGDIGCPGCPDAETDPPEDPYAVRTPDSVKRTTTLEDLQRVVQKAEASGGGWVVLVFHKVCDGCADNAVSSYTLVCFLDWLKERAALGTTVEAVGERAGPLGGFPLPPPLPPPTVAGTPSSPAFPNPWRHDRHAGSPLTITGLVPGASVSIVSLSGATVRTLPSFDGTAVWDLNNDLGQPVRSGYFLYYASGAGGGRRSGRLLIIR
ncbi:MAG: polysaccharide deacetylase family protein [Elusimicrobia bacterium]|nr:polysaccharide deacetylase family protein [Elusimicrobiota bacterium]